MKRIVLISCVSRKGTTKTKAKELYKVPLFENSKERKTTTAPAYFFKTPFHPVADYGR